MKSFFLTLALTFSLIFIPGNSFAQTINNPNSFYQANVQTSDTSVTFSISYSGFTSTPTNFVVSCSNNLLASEGYTANRGISFIKTIIGLPPAAKCELIIVSTNTTNYNPETDSQRIPFNTTGLSTGGTGQGGDGTLLGGDQNTNAKNGGGVPPTIAQTSQASSAALKSCNAIAFTSILDILIWLKCVIAAAVIPLIFTLAFLFFLWGMTMYIRGSDDVKKREESKKFIYWGIIALTVMVSVWGIVKIVNNTLGFGNTVPTLQTDYLKSPDTTTKTPPKTPPKKP